MRWAEVFKINSDMTKPLNALMNEINTAIQNKVQSHGNGVEQRFNNVDTNVGNTYKVVSEMDAKTTLTFSKLIDSQSTSVNATGSTIINAFIAPVTGLYKVDALCSNGYRYQLYKISPNAPAYISDGSYSTNYAVYQSYHFYDNCASIVALNKVDHILRFYFKRDDNEHYASPEPIGYAISDGMMGGNTFQTNGYFYATKGEPVVLTCRGSNTTTSGESARVTASIYA